MVIGQRVTLDWTFEIGIKRGPSGLVLMCTWWIRKIKGWDKNCRVVWRGGLKRGRGDPKREKHVGNKFVGSLLLMPLEQKYISCPKCHFS